LREGQDLPLDRNDELADMKVHVRQIQEDLEILRLDMNSVVNLLQVLNDNIERQNKDQFNKSMDKFEAIQKLSEISIGITLEEYEQCIRNGNYFDRHEGSCYQYEVLTDKNRDWNDAKTECVAKSGILATIHSREEWTFVKGILTSSGADNVWLGAERTEDTWVWTDGSPVTYTDWDLGSPSDDSQNCLAAYSSYNNWQWYNVLCSYPNLHAVCKIPA